jgi:4a-hydroxytetrahydrobiopterin dehydratase
LTIPDGWAVVEERLMRAYEFEDFAQAKAFIDEVSKICERQNHHADLHVGWGYAVVECYTHDQNAITDLDYTLAASINEVTMP